MLLAVVCKRIIDPPTMLGPAVHKREGSVKVFSMETMCNACEGPHHCWKSCVNGSNIVALRFSNYGTKEMFGVVDSKV